MGGKNLSMKGGPFPDGRPNLERNLSLKKRSFRFIPHPPIDFFRKMLYNKFNVKAYVKSMGEERRFFPGERAEEVESGLSASPETGESGSPGPDMVQSGDDREKKVVYRIFKNKDTMYR